MKIELFLLAVPLVLGMATACAAQSQPAAPSAPELAHTRVEFHFVADGPFGQVAPLFGANEERKWAADWNPQFIYPTPARDVPGMVFRVAHGDHSSIWVNTALDLTGGHIQYSYVLNDAMATLIDIHVTRDSAQKTGVTVVYERTALIPEANEHVQHFAKGDGKAQKEWEDSINGYLAKVRASAATK